MEGVQLDLVKKLNEIQESAIKSIEDLLGYESARSDALSKLNLPSTSTTFSKSSGSTTTDGKKEEKTSETTEEKSNSSPMSGPAYESRLAAVVSVDTLFYSKSKAIFQTCTCFVWPSQTDDLVQVYACFLSCLSAIH
jgi:hypothetical protein